MTWALVIVALAQLPGPVFVIRQGGFSNPDACEAAIKDVEYRLDLGFKIEGFSVNCVPEEKK